MNMKHGIPGEDRPLPSEVQQLFLSYRDASTEIDAGANFMPGLWPGSTPADGLPIALDGWQAHSSLRPL